VNLMVRFKILLMKAEMSRYTDRPEPEPYFPCKRCIYPVNGNKAGGLPLSFLCHSGIPPHKINPQDKNRTTYGMRLKDVKNENLLRKKRHLPAYGVSKEEKD